jgi:hypothetical protein
MSHHHHHHCQHCHEHVGHCAACHEGDHHHHGCHDQSHEEGDFAHQLLRMADEAWMEVLKEKIKKEVLAKSGDKLEKLAKIVAEANEARWHQKLSLMDAAHTFADKIRSFFSSKK